MNSSDNHATRPELTYPCEVGETGTVVTSEPLVQRVIDAYLEAED